MIVSCGGDAGIRTRTGVSPSDFKSRAVLASRAREGRFDPLLQLTCVTIARGWHPSARDVRCQGSGARASRVEDRRGRWARNPLLVRLRQGRLSSRTLRAVPQVIHTLYGSQMAHRWLRARLSSISVEMLLGFAWSVMEEEVAAVVNILLELFVAVLLSLVIMECSFRGQTLELLAVVSEEGRVLADCLGPAAHSQRIQLHSLGGDRLQCLRAELPVPTLEGEIREIQHFGQPGRVQDHLVDGLC